MARGSGLDEALEVIFRIFVPRHAHGSMAEHFSWLWGAPFFLAFLAFGIVGEALKNLGKGEASSPVAAAKARLRIARWTLFGLMLFSLFMFRFGKGW